MTKILQNKSLSTWTKLTPEWSCLRYNDASALSDESFAALAAPLWPLTKPCISDSWLITAPLLLAEILPSPEIEPAETVLSGVGSSADTAGSDCGSWSRRRHLTSEYPSPSQRPISTWTSVNLLHLLFFAELFWKTTFKIIGIWHVLNGQIPSTNSVISLKVNEWW